jgi:hypothetical protein
MIEFSEWPKIARWNRDVIITEKLDGTNAAVVIDEEGNIGAQSRKRLITPEDDNHGFAAWVHENADALRNVLGPGRHFGEWWGHGINRGYGCERGDRTFSLFNVKRWDDQYDSETWPHGLSIVPVLHWGKFTTDLIDSVLLDLRMHGSFAVFGYNRPEGIVIYHTAANEMFKVTLENDEAPKSAFVKAA